MATMATQNTVMAAAEGGDFCISIPDVVLEYADCLSRVGKEIASKVMERSQAEGVRNRMSRGQNEREVSESRDSSGTLTPGSSTTSADNSDSVFKTSWLRVQRSFETNFHIGKTKEELDNFNHAQGYDLFKNPKYEEYPEGFPQLAKLMSSSQSLTIARGFKYCHMRVLLHMMVEITKLEKELFDLDQRDAADPDMKYRVVTSLEGPDRKKSELLKALKTQLVEYDEMLLNFNRTQALGQPPKRNHFSLYNWIWMAQPLAEKDLDFALHSEDFLSGVGPRKSFFQNLIGDHLYNCPKSPLKKFATTKEEQDETSDPRVNYYSDSRLAILRKALTVAITFTVLLVPVFVLFLVPMSRGKMAATAAAAILPFSIIMSVVGGASDVENFVGSATYAAVIIVFLGNIGAINGPIPKPA